MRIARLSILTSFGSWLGQKGWIARGPKATLGSLRETTRNPRRRSAAEAGRKHAERWSAYRGARSNTDLAYHPIVEQRYPVLASAIMAASAIGKRRSAGRASNF
jgi:hypothetical protein